MDDAAAAGDEHLRWVDVHLFGGQMERWTNRDRTGITLNRGGLGKGEVRWYQVAVRGAVNRVMENLEADIQVSGREGGAGGGRWRPGVGRLAGACARGVRRGGRGGASWALQSGTSPEGAGGTPPRPATSPAGSWPLLGRDRGRQREPPHPN